MIAYVRRYWRSSGYVLGIAAIVASLWLAGSAARDARDASRQAEAASRQAQATALLAARAARRARRNAEENRVTLCAAADVVRFGAPIQVPGESDRHYELYLGAGRRFLRLAAKIDCKAVLTRARRRAAQRDDAEVAPAASGQRSDGEGVVDGGGGNNPPGQSGPGPGPSDQAPTQPTLPVNPGGNPVPGQGPDGTGPPGLKTFLDTVLDLAPGLEPHIKPLVDPVVDSVCQTSPELC